MLTATPHRHRILYVEDDEDDVQLLQNAFHRYRDKIELIIVEDGQQALQHLDNIAEAEAWPCLILLDINLPGMDGKQTLYHLKSSERFKHLPVILFTTSSGALDKLYAAKWGVPLITKPHRWEDLEDIAKDFIAHCTRKEPYTA